MPSNELAVIIRRFQRAGKTFCIHKTDGSFTYVDNNCKVIYMENGLNLEGHIKGGYQCTAFYNWIYIPYTSIVEVVQFV